MKAIPHAREEKFLVAEAVVTCLRKWQRDHGPLSLTEEEVFEVLFPVVYHNEQIPFWLEEADPADEAAVHFRELALRAGQVLSKDPALAGRLAQVMAAELSQRSISKQVFNFWLESPYFIHIPQLIIEPGESFPRLDEFNAVASAMGYVFSPEVFKNATGRLYRLQRDWPATAAGLWG